MSTEYQTARKKIETKKVEDLASFEKNVFKSRPFIQKHSTETLNNTEASEDTENENIFNTYFCSVFI